MTCCQDNKKIEFESTTDYKIGAVTYKVAAFFNAEKQQVTEKIKNLIVQEIREKEICTFVSQ